MTYPTEDPDPPEQRLPKQMGYWCKRHGIKVNKDWRGCNFLYGRSKHPHLSSGTRDGYRDIRILPHLDKMQINDGYMDRWANSFGAELSPIPRTQAEFDAAIDKLIEDAKQNVADTWPSPEEQIAMDAEAARMAVYYEEGVIASTMDEDVECPYAMDHEGHLEWLKGFYYGANHQFQRRGY